MLEYYKHEHGDLKGVVNLEDCKAVNSDLFHKKYKYVFNVETKERVYYLVASSHDEMREWVEAICRVCRFTSHLPPGRLPMCSLFLKQHSVCCEAVQRLCV